MNNKIRTQIKIAHTLVHISTPLPEEVLQAVIAYVNEKYTLHEKTTGYKPEEERKVDTLIITLLDIAAELISAKLEIKKIKQSDTEALASLDSLLSKTLDEK